MPRLVRTRQIRYALILASGISILAVTRPYEGALFAGFVGLATCWRLVRSQASLRETFTKFLLPSAAVLLATVSLLFYYNAQVTGDFKTFPYMLHHQQYELSPFFLWESPPPAEKTFRHAVLDRFHQHDILLLFQKQQELSGFLHIKLEHLFFIWFQFGSVLPAFAILFCFQRGAFRKTAAWMAGFAFLFAAVLVTPWLHAHYFAAAAPFLLLVFVTGLRHLRAAWNRQGRWVLAGLTVFYLGVSAFRLTLYAAAEPGQWYQHRARLVERLNETPGEDLVVVRYAKQHNPSHEWVYNGADIDGSPIVWAREMDPERNRRLLDYYENRRIWLLQADAEPPCLIEHNPPKENAPQAPVAPSAKQGTAVVQSHSSRNRLREIEKYPRQDSNLQPLAPEANDLSN